MEPMATMTYETVVSRKTVSIDPTLDALNDLPVTVADIHNAYIIAPVTEKTRTFLGQDFGEDYGRKAIVV